MIFFGELKISNNVLFLINFAFQVEDFFVQVESKPASLLIVFHGSIFGFNFNQFFNGRDEVLPVDLVSLNFLVLILEGLIFFGEGFVEFGQLDGFLEQFLLNESYSTISRRVMLGLFLLIWLEISDTFSLVIMKAGSDSIRI